MGKATVHQNMVVLSRLRAIAAQAQMIEDKRGEVAIADGVASTQSHRARRYARSSICPHGGRTQIGQDSECRGG